jgi:hypothetical protein
MAKYVHALVLVLLSAVSASAQTTGSITGTITDVSNAVLPGVLVTATSPAQMGAQVAVSNEQGQYRFPSVPIGTYTLKYELAGFATVTREGIIVTIGFTASVSVQLKLATMAEAQDKFLEAKWAGRPQGLPFKSPREAIILRARFGLDGGPQKTLEEVGQKFGVTRERVRQIQNIALKKLRKMIERMETTKT